MSQELTFTAGIVNTPLTKPARLFFIITDISKVHDVKMVYESMSIGYEMTTRKNGRVFHFISLNEVEPDKLKVVWRNYKTLRPKFQSDYRYLFYEIDIKDWNTLDSILYVYRELSLPVYVHETLHGYHFLSVKPIHRDVFKSAIEQVRKYNPKYPPITLRIKPNKHPDEPEMYKIGFIISEKWHSDTQELKNWIETQQLEKIGQKYIVVNYII